MVPHPLAPLLVLATALGAGLLIGLERQHASPTEKEARSFIGGVRTYPLVGLTGALAMMLARVGGYWLLGVAFVALAALLAISYHDDVRAGRERGITSEVAFFVTFLLGALAAAEEVVPSLADRAALVLATAVVATLFLAGKPPLHRFAASISRADVRAALKFLVVALVVLPVLPDRAYGPLSVLNPFRIGLLVVLIAAIDLAAYVLIRVLGAERGLGLTGLVGGLASSTATTLSVASRTRREPELVQAGALAVVVASTIMFPRVLVEVALVDRALLVDLLAPMLTMTAVGAGASWLLFRRSRETAAETSVDVIRPFELRSAFFWGVLFAVVLLATKAASTWFGDEGIYVAGLLAGATDVDAITLSTARLTADGTLARDVAATTIVLGTVSNTLVKGAMAWIVGGWRFAWRVLLAYAATLLAGGAALLF